MKKNILLISENEKYEKALVELGHETIVAFSASEARIFLDKKLDVIIIDPYFLFSVNETAKFVGRIINDYEYHGPIAVIAEEEKSRLPLLKAGCGYEVSGPDKFSKVLNSIFKNF